MDSLYSRPLRVYIILGALAIWGIISGFQLPISLFPNSSQITVSVNIPTGSLSSQQFFEVYGNDLESNLQGMKVESVPVKEIEADYSNQNVNFQITFEWGADPEKAISDVQNLVNSRMASAGEDIRRGISVYSWNENKRFFCHKFL